MLSLLHLNFHLLFVLSFFHLLSSSPVFLLKFHLSFLELQFVFFKREFSFPQCRLFFVTSLKSLHCCQTAATLGNYRCLATSFSVKLNVSNIIWHMQPVCYGTTILSHKHTLSCYPLLLLWVCNCFNILFLFFVTIINASIRRWFYGKSRGPFGTWV